MSCFTISLEIQRDLRDLRDTACNHGTCRALVNETVTFSTRLSVSLCLACVSLVSTGKALCYMGESRKSRKSRSNTRLLE